MTTAEVDWDRAAFLCRAGAPDFVAAVCIHETGEETLWLVSLPVLDGEAQGLSGDADSAKHEGLGRLPVHIRDRIWGDALRCGRPRSNGLPCRARVGEPGAACCVHADQGVRR